MKVLKMFSLILLCAFLLTMTAHAGDPAPEGHQAMAGETPPGKHIKTSTVDNHTLAYYLLDRNESTADAAHTMPGMAHSGDKDKKPDHLMVTITGPDGRKIEDARVGYLVTSGTGKTQKAMTMAMPTGYGADVTLEAGQTYTIKVKLQVGAVTLLDEFSHKAE